MKDIAGPPDEPLGVGKTLIVTAAIIGIMVVVGLSLFGSPRRHAVTPPRPSLANRADSAARGVPAKVEFDSGPGVRVVSLPTPRPAARVRHEPRAPRTPDARDLVAQMQSAGVILTLERFDGGTYVTVGDAFYTFEYRHRRNAMRVVSMTHPRGKDYVRIMDAYTNKHVGTYMNGELDWKGDR